MKTVILPIHISLENLELACLLFLLILTFINTASVA
jgi:hypothetical protein